MRASGVLLPIASLPSPYGIGCFSKEAYEFIDQLKEAGQKYWQILPLGPTGYGDSPYQSFSTYAGNPYFIDLEELIEQGFLTKKECEETDFGQDARKIDYEKIYFARFKILKKAFERINLLRLKGYKTFCHKEKGWLEDYALFMAVKDYFQGKSFIEWDEAIRFRKPEAMKQYSDKLKDEIEFYKFLQFEFMRQWKKLKKYAANQGIKMIGDIPIYVAFDSADTWAMPQLFQFNQEGIPTAVAGCPPDDFSPTGQLWGNPLYNWAYHKKTGYKWWQKRIKHSYELYDVVRIDHFRGFDEYYAIPYGDKTAENGRWEKGPGYNLFKVLKEELGEQAMIAEDLGFLTESVRKLVKKTGYPGMKVLQFAFDSREESDYLPYHYDKNCIVYTGTHDNNTVMGWYETISKEDKKLFKDYLGVKTLKKQEASWALIRLALASVADTCIIPIQDYLGLGEEARINEPSTVGNNWKWRLLKGEIKETLIEDMRRMSKLYGRTL